jgi:hypothetical protein
MSNIKDCWVGTGNSPDVNPIEKISLAVQKLGDQLLIVPIGHPAPPAMEARVDRVDAVDGETDGDVDVSVDGGVALAANAGSRGYWASKSSMETETLFSQQFILQQRMDDLYQEMISLFGVQISYLQNMNTNVKWIAAHPVVCPYSTQRRITGHLSSSSHGTMNVEATSPRMEDMRSGVKLSRNPKDLYMVWKE